MSTAPIVHGGGIAEAAARFGGRVEDWLDLSTGINPNPVGLPDIPMNAWHGLPDRHLTEAATGAARHYYRSVVTPLAVPGTQSVIQLLPRLLSAGRRAAIFGPTYGEYGRVLRAAGYPVDEIVDCAGISPEHALVIVVNPNNPTGRMFDADVLLSILLRVEGHDGMLLVDEAFGDTQPEASVASMVDPAGRLVVLRSFGKFFGLAGLRLGFVIAPDAVTVSFREWLGPWAVSGPALVIAADLMGRETTTIAAAIAERKQRLDDILLAAGLPIVGGTPLFTLVDHPRAGSLHTALCQSRILTRRFDYAPTWLRIGLSPDVKGDVRLAHALHEFAWAPHVGASGH
ncbi:cobalamin biosynthetic protein CobC [Pararhizobium capsulatum DSM 1112]|uniref:threonine-phosphate decarboxylase n=1 Tax=Pararhizobium capsulatum DSM 1112 TaxID=1121113 RepID=A0ABU0BQZ4_9HYPH|nr:threonine-phosphate decarboxylase CobD [Pararhizobium capsulatum]MDQ0320673.1 cobalamin biosynthetic protein CobC [Pararhizobium capsulatum DSM 1112]